VQNAKVLEAGLCRIRGWEWCQTPQFFPETVGSSFACRLKAGIAITAFRFILGAFTSLRLNSFATLPIQQTSAHHWSKGSLYSKINHSTGASKRISKWRCVVVNSGIISEFYFSALATASFLKLLQYERMGSYLLWHLLPKNM